MSSNAHANNEVFALCDCNSFYVSCERAFNPKLRRLPVIVLSNNDGCTISRSKEAKAIGIKMGEPLFKIRNLVKQHDVKVYSSNYTLYGEMSSRVMSILGEFTPEMEVYSIDEAFLSFRGFNLATLVTYSEEIRRKVYQYTSIPISIGIGPTKVLAKLSNNLAKKNENGVFSFFHISDKEKMLKDFPISDVWGIGRKSAVKLKQCGIMSAYDLAHASPLMVRDKLTVVGSRIQSELNEVSCLSLEQVPKKKKQIVSSRSFGCLVRDIEQLNEAISNHASRIGEKLRQEGSVCSSFQVFLETNRFRHQDVQYNNAITINLPYPTNNTNALISYAIHGINHLFKEGLNFNKCGVIGMNLTPQNERQLDLFTGEKSEAFQPVISVMDKINQRFGTSTLKFGSCGVKKHWEMRSEYKSKCYTTRIEDLVLVK